MNEAADGLTDKPEDAEGKLETANLDDELAADWLRELDVDEALAETADNEWSVDSTKEYGSRD